MQTISIKQPDGGSVQVCTTWPNDVKPYLAALLRGGFGAGSSFMFEMGN